MFFILSKIGGALTMPPTIAIGVIVLAAILSWTSYTKAARGLLTIGAIILVVLAFSPLEALLIMPLQHRFPTAPADLPPPTGIIVLGGANARVLMGAALAHKYPEAKLVFTGGSASLGGSGPSEASSAKRLWTSIGVPQANALYEDKARNTWENAVFTRELLHPKPDERWFLVTSATQMARSMGLFRKAGFSVIAFPTDYRSLGNSHDWLSIDPAKSMENIEIATHEWIGLFLYWLTGKIDSLFPASGQGMQPG
jgi:uncharacterized SAM-binding protein YcdF (DUF218 family)